MAGKALLRLYHGLPHPLRELVASGRGHYLRRWRYDAATDDAADAALERDTWSAATWESWRAARLEYLLHRAATRVPYYRDYWRGRRQGAWSDLAAWPVLDKEALRASPEAFVADDCDPRRMFGEHTSGTTGKPLSLWFRRDTVLAWYAIFEARARRWNGVTRHDRWVNIGGQQVVPFGRDRPPFWIWNSGLRQLYMSSYHLAPQFADAYVAALARYEIVYLHGYSSSLHALAELALERGLACPAQQTVIANAEPLYDVQREAIARAFGTAARETYGMSEIACAASECAAGVLHWWPDVGVVELLADDSERPADAAAGGRIVATGLLNADMPLIRYQVGDRATAGSEAPCACGRTLPRVGRIEGRIDDTLVTRDGRRIGRLDPVFKGDLPIREAQIVQETLTSVRINVVAGAGYDERHSRLLANNLRERMGDIDVNVDLVSHIPRGANGKFRAVVNRIRPGGQ